MKKIYINIFLYCLLIINISFSQTKKKYAKALVSYSVKTDLEFDKDGESYKRWSKYIPDYDIKREAASSELDFSLIFNDSISIFYLEKKLYSDNDLVSLALIDVGYYGRIKQQPKNYITEELQESFGKFLVSRSYQKWVLHDETKQIGEYLCFKATTFHTTTNPKGKVFKHNFTAWYTPQIPYKFGPAGYGNLPGLIIQLQGDKATYGVKKIEFYNTNEKSKKNRMPKLKNKKLISEEKFEKLAAEDEKRWRSKH